MPKTPNKPDTKSGETNPAKDNSPLVDRNLFENMAEGLAYCEVVLDKKGAAQDWRYLYVNKAYLRITGLKQVKNRLLSEVMPTFKKDNRDMFKALCECAITGQSGKREVYIVPLDRWLRPSYFSPSKNQFIAIFENITEQKRAARNLAASEARFQTLFNKNASAMAIYSTDTTIEMVNDKYCEIIGFPREELIGKSWTTQVSPLELTRLTEYNKLRLSGSKKAPDKYEFQFITKSGVLKTVLASFAMIENGAKIQASYQDITEQVEANKNALEVREQFKYLFENMTQGVVVMSRDLKITSANEAAARILGLSVNQLLGKSPMDPRWRAIHEDGSDWPGQDHPGPVSLKTGKAIEEVVQGIFDPGRNEYRWIQVSATPRFKVGEKKPFETVATFTDITDLKIAEGRLKRQAQTIKGIINSTGGPVFSLDRKYRYTSFNEMHQSVMKALYGVDVELGKNMLDYMTIPADRKIAKANIDKALAGEQVIEEAFSGEESRQRSYFEVSHNPIKNDIGKVIGVGIMARDMTAKRAAEIALKESETRYRDLFSSMREGFAFCRAIFDKQGHLIDWVYVDANKAFGKITGLKKVVGKKISDILPNHRAENPELFELYEGVLKSGKPTDIETYVEPLRQWLRISIFSPIEGHFVAVFEDITIQKTAEIKHKLEAETSKYLLRLHEDTAGMDDLELYQFILEMVVKLTDSEVGFFHEVSEEADSVKLTAWTESAKKNCTVPAVTHYPFKDAGNWLDCVRERQPLFYNDYRKSPNQKGLPKGHFPLTKYLSFPVFHEGKIRFVFGVGNKAGDYTNDDIVQATILADGMMKVILAREAEAALLEAERRTRAIIDNAPFGAHLYRLDPDDRLVFIACNESSDRILGMKASDLFGLTLEEAFPGNIGTELPEMYRRVAKTGEPYMTRQISYDAKGISGVFEVHAVQTSPMHMVAFFADVTETAKAQLELEKSEKKYHDIFDNATEGIVQATVDGEPITANPRFIKMLGFDNESEFRRRILSMKQLYVREKDREPMIEQLLKTGHVSKYEVEMRKNDGQHIWVSINSSLVSGEQIEKPYLESLIEDITDRRKVEQELIESHNNLEESLLGLVSTLALTVETRDPYTAEHQKRVTDLSVAIAEDMGLSDDDIAGLKMAASIHDIGKIYVPAETLNKPGKVTSVEFELIKTHSAAGHNIVKDIKFSQPISEIILQHHERIDGSGYPSGLTGSDIHIRAKIVAVADVVEAMCSHRPYRPALGVTAALDEIEKNSGTLYDKDVASACLKIFQNKTFTFK